MKILVTGFEPFGEEIINPSYEVVKNLSHISNCEIIKLKVPVVYNKSIDIIVKKIKDIHPDVVLMVGLAGGRSDITVERVAINISDSDLADNEGLKLQDEPIDKNGHPAYFSTLPIKEVVSNIRKHSIPVSVSNTAGTYVCNHLMYGVLNYTSVNNLPIKAGLIHIPYLLEQAANKYNIPSMSLDTIIKGIKIAIETIVDGHNVGRNINIQELPENAKLIGH